MVAHIGHLRSRWEKLHFSTDRSDLTRKGQLGTKCDGVKKSIRDTSVHANWEHPGAHSDVTARWVVWSLCFCVFVSFFYLEHICLNVCVLSLGAVWNDGKEMQNDSGHKTATKGQKDARNEHRRTQTSTKRSTTLTKDVAISLSLSSLRWGVCVCVWKWGFSAWL